ncbi:hypothetical protein AVEN_209203-1 [Araneus ventricosus]|uniref:Uncharacterized protein n=1 Tax=Araneus ventricosus TaxID=182803 RepID=A0A4Y2Q5D2_ARAVE|nr:hypothetical protein AVEN_209203-1 [Araneus ventricosus]
MYVLLSSHEPLNPETSLNTSSSNRRIHVSTKKHPAMPKHLGKPERPAATTDNQALWSKPELAYWPF